MKFLLIFIAILLIIPNVIFAQTTSEIDINQLYLNISTIMHPTSENELERFIELPQAIDNTVKILKLAPGSFEAYCAIKLFNGNVRYHQAAKEKYLKMKETFLNNLDDIDNDTAEKLMFMTILVNSDPGSTGDDEKINTEYKTVRKSLIKIKDEHSNKDYAALATSILFDMRYNTFLDEFIRNYPIHPAVPVVKLTIVGRLGYDKKYEECIRDINILLEKYQDLKMPDGWAFKCLCYSLLIITYCEMKDTINAQKFYDLLFQAAPNYYDLNDLREFLSHTKQKVQ